jgi:ATP-dependent DNA ligase
MASSSSTRQIDGWRIQLHKHGRSAAAFTKNGHAHSSRVRWMTDALARLPGVRFIDGELVACDGAGVPHFYALQFHSRLLAAHSAEERRESERGSVNQ